MLSLYNSLSNKKETFQPRVPGQAGMYSCGPTVYGRVHIGNLRAFLTADLLYRVLSNIEGLAVNWVMNITDIDDRMIDQLRSIKPSADPLLELKKLANKNILSFKKDLTSVGINLASITFLRATEHIERMQHMIRHLHEQGIAYISDGSVYFSIDRYKKAGHKYGLLVNLAGEKKARVTDDQDQKEGVADFALWKAAHTGEPSWDFELDGVQLPGRPGWHIECSAMSTAVLGGEFDIHTGGVDLKFPHHENEIAQCGGVLAQFFVHNEHVQVDARKMSKSLGNFTTLSDITDPLAFRYLCLQAHYRSQMEITATALVGASERLNNIRAKVARGLYVTDPIVADNGAKFRYDFTAALEDDLSTTTALRALAGYEDNYLQAGFVDAIKWADQILALNLVPKYKPFTKVELAIQNERNAARKGGDYARSDELRLKLARLGIESEDSGATSLYWRGL